jgi:hypothetical protein
MGSKPMLAEAFMLRLEAIVRNAHVPTASGRDQRFVPIALPTNPARNPQLSSTKETAAKEG